jgi:hypothetical protein
MEAAVPSKYVLLARCDIGLGSRKRPIDLQFKGINAFYSQSLTLNILFIIQSSKDSNRSSALFQTYTNHLMRH